MSFMGANGEVWPAWDPYPQTSRASEDELRQVAEKLVAFRDLVSGLRMEPASPGMEVLGRAALDGMAEDGTLGEARRYWAERERRIGALMEWYGDAVRRTQGADPQDLITLANLGVISDPEKKAPPTPQTPEHGALGSIAWTPASSTSSYHPDDDFDELKALVSTFLGEFAWISGTLATSSKETPRQWGDRLQQAIELKRRGSFLQSARIYVDVSRSSGVVHTDALLGLYKTVATAGHLVGGLQVLHNGDRIYRENPDPLAVAAGIESSFADHRARLLAATRSPLLLEDYLRSIAGNPGYYMPRDYATMVAELKAHIEWFASAVQNLSELSESASKPRSGCYVATAVYGSYECPEVWVLRRYRDVALMKSAPGRQFVRAYYTVSPMVLRLLGGRGGSLFRRPIAVLVRALEARGFSNAPYADPPSSEAHLSS